MRVLCEFVGCNRPATEEHHALITKRMAMKCGDELRRHIEKPINKLRTCQKCHTGNGHVSRVKSKEAVLNKGYIEEQIKEFFDTADMMVKVKFKRV